MRNSVGFRLILAALGVLFASCEEEDNSRRLLSPDAAVADGADADHADGSSADAAPTDGAAEDAGEESPADAMSGDAGLPLDAILGYYSGDWGNMVLRQVGN